MKSSGGSLPRYGSRFKNGADATCDLIGNNVQFVREAGALPALTEIRICTLGIMASPRYKDIQPTDILLSIGESHQLALIESPMYDGQDIVTGLILR